VLYIYILDDNIQFLVNSKSYLKSSITISPWHLNLIHYNIFSLLTMFSKLFENINYFTNSLFSEFINSLRSLKVLAIIVEDY
jgi:hypothetical protein